MASKLVFALFVAFCLFQALTWETEARMLRRREAHSPLKDTSQTIDEALESLKAGLQDIAKNIKNNDLIQNMTGSIQKFAEEIHTKGKELIDNAQKN